MSQTESGNELPGGIEDREKTGESADTKYVYGIWKGYGFVVLEKGWHIRIHGSGSHLLSL